MGGYLLRSEDGQAGRDRVQRIEDAFAGQLGERWAVDIGEVRAALAEDAKGPLDHGVLFPPGMPYHQKALLAAFVIRINKNKDLGNALIGALARAWAEHHDIPENCQTLIELKEERKKGKIKVVVIHRRPIADLVNETLCDRKQMRALLPVYETHGWTTTFFLGAQELARKKSGVLATAEFNWLRAQDRRLYYALNALGRRSFFVEASGAITHWRMECQAGKALQKPAIGIAVESIQGEIERYRKK